MTNEQYRDKCESLESEVAYKLEDIDRLHVDLRKKDERLEQFFLNKGSDATFQIEV